MIFRNPEKRTARKYRVKMDKISRQLSDLEKLAAAYHMDFARLENMDRAGEVIREFLKEDKSMLLECIIDPMDLVK